MCEAEKPRGPGKRRPERGGARRLQLKEGYFTCFFSERQRTSFWERIFMEKVVNSFV